MNFLVAMPRETDTSLFTSRVSQGLFLMVCLIGLVLNILVFFKTIGTFLTDVSKSMKMRQRELKP